MKKLSRCLLCAIVVLALAVGLVQAEYAEKDPKPQSSSNIVSPVPRARGRIALLDKDREQVLEALPWEEEMFQPKQGVSINIVE